MSANEWQAGGSHYKGQKVEHWDFVLMHDIPYLEAQIIKYVMRHKKKNGAADLKKAEHFLEKLVETSYPTEISAADVMRQEQALAATGRHDRGQSSRGEAGGHNQLEITEDDVREQMCPSCLRALASCVCNDEMKARGHDYFRG